MACMHGHHVILGGCGLAGGRAGVWACGVWICSATSWGLPQVTGMWWFELKYIMNDSH